jgi:hypothetical protein
MLGRLKSISTRTPNLVALLGSTTTLVATGTTTSSTASSLSSGVCAVSGDVSRLATLVAGFVLWSLRALTACGTISFLFFFHAVALVHSLI